MQVPLLLPLGMWQQAPRQAALALQLVVHWVLMQACPTAHCVLSVQPQKPLLQAPVVQVTHAAPFVPHAELFADPSMQAPLPLQQKPVRQ